ncbi:hypothetical protein ACFFGH_00565 [Lysobacter korlensis]|uniref:Uncharacterized protein n=1 Tax=Lysobacter korlensis TaxID=553636 RepID=A0ABV6RH76_9GAMM
MSLRRTKTALPVLLACLVCTSAQAFVVAISSSPRSMFLRVGDGGAGTFESNNGRPGESAVVNRVSADVPAALLASGTGLLPMVTDATQLTSSYEGYAFCNENQIYVGGFVRGGQSDGVLRVDAPAGLINTSSGDTIPFSRISWTASGNGDGDSAQPIPSGVFDAVDGPQTLATFARNTFRESCHSFSLAIADVVPAGRYEGRVTYTLSAP